MNVPRFFSMSVKLKNHSFCTKGYQCMVTISFRQFVWGRKPGLVQILSSAIQLLLYCLASRSLDSGISNTKVDFTCLRDKGLDFK